jgi:kynureninase
VLAAHFRHYFDANPGRLHFAAHSHHPWPDATRAAQERCWIDAATLADRKWERIFGEVVPHAQRHVARLLGLSDPKQVAFAPNTHEFVTRLYSCLEGAGPHRVLCSAHEFHSFRRQTRRLQEDGLLDVVEVPLEPWSTFTERFVAAARSGPWDLVFLSHVFFDSGFVVQDLDAICAAAPAQAIVAIDAYHAFCSIPVDYSGVHRRAFVLGGGYKYAMSGEGCCFLAIPPGCALRPKLTGWFASFDTLPVQPGDAVPYAHDGMRFAGATFDASGLYRFGAAMDWLQSSGTTITDVHRHAVSMQKHFLDGLARIGLSQLRADALVPPAEAPRGNFLAFEVDDAEELHRRIAGVNVTIDRRGRRLRFGFGVYHDEHAVRRLLEALATELG